MQDSAPSVNRIQDQRDFFGSLVGADEQSLVWDEEVNGGLGGFTLKAVDVTAGSQAATGWQRIGTTVSLVNAEDFVGIGGTPTRQFQVRGPTPVLSLWQTDGPPDEKEWVLYAEGSKLYGDVIVDVQNNGYHWLEVTRSGFQATQIAFLTGASVERMRIDPTTLNVNSAGAMTSQIRWGLDSTNSGGYLTSLHEGSALLCAGVNNVSSVWMARHHSAGIYENNSGSHYWYGNTGLVPGNPYSPATLAVVTSAGQLRLPVPGPTGGILLGGDAPIIQRSAAGVLHFGSTVFTRNYGFAVNSMGGYEWDVGERTAAHGQPVPVFTAFAGYQAGYFEVASSYPGPGATIGGFIGSTNWNSPGHRNLGGIYLVSDGPTPNQTGGKIYLRAKQDGTTAFKDAHFSQNGVFDVPDGLVVGGTAINASCALQIESNKAVLLPRLSTGERDALAGVNGMIIYNSTTGKFEGYAGGAWVALH